MNSIKTFLTLLLAAGTVNAASVDLSSWVAADVPGDPASNWVVEGTENDSVVQEINSRPSFFFKPNTDSQGNALSGSITVETSNDDDFIGFALGLDDGEIGSATTDFILIDWKQGEQYWAPFGGTGKEGLAISHVTSADAESPFWWHDTSNGVTEIERGSTLGNTGWLDNTSYDFELVFTSSLIRVFVNNNLELEITPADVTGLSSFDDGSFGFYNYSQSTVRYSAIEEDVAQVAEAGQTGVLLSLGALGLLVMRLKA